MGVTKLKKRDHNLSGLNLNKIKECTKESQKKLWKSYSSKYELDDMSQLYILARCYAEEIAVFNLWDDILHQASADYLRYKETYIFKDKSVTSVLNLVRKMHRKFEAHASELNSIATKHKCSIRFNPGLNTDVMMQSDVTLKMHGMYMSIHCQKGAQKVVERTRSELYSLQKEVITQHKWLSKCNQKGEDDEANEL